MTEHRIVFQGRRFKVEQQQVAGSDGQVHPYEIIRHPGAAVILPLLDDVRIVMIHNHRVPVEQELLELPAGTLDPGEPPLACARRELTEETGYTAARLEPLVSFFSSPGICDERLHAFVARDLTAGPSRLEPSERIRGACLPLDEALAAIGAGRIIDGKTIATLLYYNTFRRA